MTRLDRHRAFRSRDVVPCNFTFFENPMSDSEHAVAHV